MNTSIFIRQDTLQVDYRFLGKERLGGQPGHDVHREAGDRAMPGMLDLGYILQLVADGLDQRPLAEEDLVRNGHDLPLHVALQFCNQQNPVHEKPGEEFLADASLVPDQLAEDLLDEGLATERLPVVDIAGRDHEVQQVPLLVADLMQFEPVEPSHRELASLVPAHAQRHTENFRDFVVDDRHSESVCIFIVLSFSNLQKLSLLS